MTPIFTDTCESSTDDLPYCTPSTGSPQPFVYSVLQFTSCHSPCNVVEITIHPVQTVSFYNKSNGSYLYTHTPFSDSTADPVIYVLLVKPERTTSLYLAKAVRPYCEARIQTTYYFACSRMWFIFDLKKNKQWFRICFTSWEYCSDGMLPRIVQRKLI